MPEADSPGRTEGRNLLVHHTMRNTNLCLMYRFLLTSFVEMTGSILSVLDNLTK